METGEDGLALDDDVLSRVLSTLSRHPVTFAMVFGSVARDETREGSDVDLAVEFDSLRPDDAGYSDAYLRLRSDLDEDVPVDVDVVDVRSMSPSFARVVFDDGHVIVGSDGRRDELEDELAGDRPSVTEARERVAAAAKRLRENSATDRGILRE